MNDTFKNKTVHQLRLEGNKIRICHYRYHVEDVMVPGERLSLNFARRKVRPDNSDRQNRILLQPQGKIAGFQKFPRGGLTTVQITDKNGQEWYGRAECAVSDNFNRKRGVRIAMNRLHEVDSDFEDNEVALLK